MLSCQECQKYLVAFLDGALDVAESLDVEEHLRACTSCTNRVEAEQTLRAFVRQHATTPPLPEELKRRIVRRAMQSTHASRWWSLPRLPGPLRDFAIGVTAAAAVLFLVFGPFSSSSSRDDVLQKLVQEASMAYSTYITQRMPPEVVSADDKVVAQWFNNCMGRQFKVPCITDKATKLLGGRLCRLLDRKAAALMYRRGDVDILLFAFEGGHISLPKKHRIPVRDRVFYVQSVAGRPVAMWQRGNMTYSIVGDMDRNELLRLATTIDYH
jgi:mycothiol system anti-sigma-R factor